MNELLFFTQGELFKRNESMSNITLDQESRKRKQIEVVQTNNKGKKAKKRRKPSVANPKENTDISLERKNSASAKLCHKSTHNMNLRNTSNSDPTCTSNKEVMLPAAELHVASTNPMDLREELSDGDNQSVFEFQIQVL